MAISVKLQAAIPTSPLVDDLGRVTPAWFAFFLSLYERTGGSQGASSDTTILQALLVAERQARIQADSNLGNALTDETLARQQADDDWAAALAAETQARTYADSLLLPTALLASAWSQSNILAVLPTSDPGGGRPWNHAGVVTVGTVVGHQDFIGNEDGAAWWRWEDNVMSILWG